MASHLSAIGFAAHDMDGFARLAGTAAERGERLDARHVRWAAGGGAELWVVLDRRGRVCGMQPHFAGEAVVPVGITDVLAHDGCDVTLELWMAPADERPDSGIHRLAVDVAGAGLVDAVELPARAELQAAVFAHELDVYADEDAFAAAQRGREPPFAVPSTVPTGLVGHRPAAELLAHATVLDAGWRENGASGRRFAWLRVDALGGELDVVAEPLLLTEPPPRGAIVRVAGWVSGRLHDVEALPGRARRFRRGRRLGGA